MDVDDRLLLIDIENAVGHPGASAAAVHRRVGALLDAAGGVHHAVASYPRPDAAPDVLACLLAELRVAPLPVPPGVGAADAELLRHARHVHARGGRRFVVASADRQFAALGELGSVEVVLFEGQPLSRRLEQVAGAVRRVPRPGGPRVLAPNPGAGAAAALSGSVREDGGGAMAAPVPGAGPTGRPGRGWRALVPLAVCGLGVGAGQRAVSLAVGRWRAARSRGGPGG